jgi:hypothetical protein
VAAEFSVDEKEMVTQTLTDTVLDLKTELQEKKAVEKELANKLSVVE